jgi:hypothetical protein
VQGLKHIALSGVNTGADEEVPTYVAACTLDVSLNVHAGRGVRLMYTRDLEEGQHSLHLSMSFRLYRKNLPLAFDHRFARHAATMFFTPHLERVQVYPPQFPSGREWKVWHFRLLTDERWLPLAEASDRLGPLWLAWPEYSKASFA